MKKILFVMFLFAAVLYGAPMACKDNISKKLTVKNDFWSCSFIEGAMFPGEFVFVDGSSAGAILFRDTAVCRKQVFQLFEERHAECRIIRNTKDEFIVEFRGTFWRNISPVITPLNGVKVVCRYEFKRNEPSVKMIYRYDFKNAENIVFNNFFNIGWYYENPFDKGFVDGKRFDISKGTVRKGSKKIAWGNSKFTVQLESENVFAEIPRKKNIIVCLLGQADKRTVTGSGSFEKRAVLRLKK